MTRAFLRSPYGPSRTDARDVRSAVHGFAVEPAPSVQPPLLIPSLANNKNGPQGSVFVIGRGGGIRTHDPLPPRQMRYQAALRPDLEEIIRD